MNANEEFCAVFKISIGAMRMILAAEMDCAMVLGPDKVWGFLVSDRGKRDLL